MVLRRAVDQPNRWVFRCRANVNRERVAVRRAAGKLFQMTGPATMKLLISSVVLVLDTDSVPVPADRRCRLSAMAEIARQSSAKYVGANPCRYLVLWLSLNQVFEISHVFTPAGELISCSQPADMLWPEYSLRLQWPGRDAVSLSDFGLLGKQSSPKWEIPCPGCWRTSMQNVTLLALSSLEKSVTILTKNTHKNCKRNIHTLPIGTCG